MLIALACCALAVTVVRVQRADRLPVPALHRVPQPQVAANTEIDRFRARRVVVVVVPATITVVFRGICPSSRVDHGKTTLNCAIIARQKSGRL